MVSNKIRKHCGLLKWLNNAKASQTKAFIKAADKEIINTLCECSLNILRGNISLSPKQKLKLKRYKKGLRQLADKKVSLKTKKSLLQAKGSGLLGAILGGAIPFIGSIASLFK